MYHVQREIDAKGVRIRTVEGSIFEAENNGALGVAIFVPCGLTALRANLPEYMIPFGLPKTEGESFAVFRSQKTVGEVTVLCNLNRANAILPARGIPLLLCDAMDMFEQLGICHVAMNGIRVCWPKGVRDHGHLAEAYLMDNALYGLETHEHHFKSIDFVDLRGGFGKAHLEEWQNQV